MTARLATEVDRCDPSQRFTGIMMFYRPMKRYSLDFLVSTNDQHEQRRKGVESLLNT